jgi:hypothetical protein
LGVQFSAEGSEGVPTAHAFGGYWTFIFLPKAPDNSEIVNLHSSIVNCFFASANAIQKQFQKNGLKRVAEIIRIINVPVIFLRPYSFQ